MGTLIQGPTLSHLHCPQLSSGMLDDFTLKVSFLAVFLIVVSLFVSGHFSQRGDPTLNAIPTVGFSDPILSYLSAAQYLFDGHRMLKEGYEKTRPGLFKIANFRRWMVLATGYELIDDVRRAPDYVLSRIEPIDEFIQPEYTLSLSETHDEYSIDIIRSKLGRDIPGLFPKTSEELVMAMDELIPRHEDKWVKVPIQETFNRVICRSINRSLVGVPLCRDHNYQNLNLAFAVNVLKFGFTISLFPSPLKPIVSRILSNLPSQIQQEIEYIRPMVEERSAKMKEYGEDWDNRPNDILTSLMNKTQEVGMSLEGLARRLLVVNFSGIHATSMTLTQVLYRLLTNPEFIEPLRQEVETVIRDEGWTKTGLDKMHKIDSFLRETQRIDGISSVATTRLALRPFTFSNGVTVPAGTLVSMPSSATHRDEKIYPNADVFDGFRFAKLREDEVDETTSRYQTVCPSNEYLPFGLGRYACPGRFFAAMNIKILLAYIVSTYDIKFEEGQRVPPELFLAGVRFPGNANAMFRARQK